MGKRALTREELELQLEDHKSFIAASCAAFDAGAMGEAKRIAVSIRVLLHHTAMSHSILGQLAARSGNWLAYSYQYDPRNLVGHQGLVKARATVGAGTASATFVAHLREVHPGPRALRFEDWWSNDVVLKDSSGGTYSRRELVLFAANKDGGAHVDGELDESYERLKDGSGLGITVHTAAGSTTIPDVIAHSIRQIGFEVLEHLK